MAENEQRSLRAVYSDAEQKRTTIENSFDSNSASFQDNLTTTIQLYEECVKVAEQISLFSPNESLEDIGTADLQYLLLHHRIADLVQKINTGIEHRKSTLERAQRHYERYLKQLDNYDILSKPDAKLLEQYRDSPTTFSTASTADAALRRETKIRRFKEEKSLKQKLEFLRNNPRLVQEDDGKARELHLTEIEYCTHQTFASLEGIAQELHILSKAPPPSQPQTGQRPSDVRERERAKFDKGYSERLDGPSHLSAGMKGPLLDKAGKPLRPFTLLARDEMRQGVFRPDHSLPTMTIDEYLEEERRRGGMIDGGGEASRQQKEVVDEDDMDAADQATYKAREWDEYVEGNPKGSGNTMNRG